MTHDDFLEHFNRGVAAQDAGRADVAIREFRAAIRLEPGAAKAHGGLGAVLADSGRHEEAIAEIEAAVKLDPGEAVYHFHLGVYLGIKGRSARSLAAFEAFLALAGDGHKDFVEQANGYVTALKGNLGEPAAPTVPGRIIVFSGPKEGVGKSTIAVNLALAWAAVADRKVIVVQLDPLCRSELPFLLGVEPTTLSALTQDTGKNVRVPISQWNVGTLSLGLARGDAATLSPGRVLPILEGLSRSYDLFIDVDPSGPLQTFAFDLADIVFWSCLPQRAHLNATRGMFQDMTDRHFPMERFEVVVNEADLPGLLSAAEVGRFFKAMGKDVASFMPFDERLLEFANTARLAIIEENRSRWVQALQPLLARVVALEPGFRIWGADFPEQSVRAEVIAFKPMPSAKPPEEDRRVIVFSGPKEGAGTTTLALNMALAWAGAQSRNVILVHMDPLCRSELPFLLGLELHSLARLARTGGEVKVPFSKWGVGVLALGDDRFDAAAMPPRDLVRILKKLNESYDLFIDAAPFFPLQAFAFSLADAVFWSCLPQRTHLEATQGIFSDLKELCFPMDRFEVVINEGDLPGMLDPKEVERYFKTIDKDLLSFLPFDDRMPEFNNSARLLLLEQPHCGWIEALGPLFSVLKGSVARAKDWGPDLEERFRGAAGSMSEAAGEVDPAVVKAWRKKLGRVLDEKRFQVTDDPRLFPDCACDLGRIISDLLREEPLLALPRLNRKPLTDSLLSDILGLETLRELSHAPVRAKMRSLYADVRKSLSVKLNPFLYYAIADAAQAGGDPSLALQVYDEFRKAKLIYRDVVRRRLQLEEDDRAS